MIFLKIYKKELVALAVILLFFGVLFLTSNRASQADTNIVANNILAKCSANQNPESCYAKEFVPIAEKQGPNFSFEVLFVLQKKDSKAIGCHLIAHGIGLGTYQYDPSNWQSEIRNINSACSYGAIHGIIENYIASLPDRKLSIEIIPNICGERPRADCNHIIGHLILVETKADVNNALDMCDIFKKDSVQLNHCYTGVFMEYQTALNLIEHGLAPRSWLNWPVRVPELEKMCRKYNGNKAIACWKEIVHAVAVKYKNNAQEVFTFCDSAPIKEAAFQCKSHSIGIMAATFDFDYHRTRSMCEVNKKDFAFINHCYSALVASTLSTIPRAIEESRKFCDSIDIEYQQDCMFQVNYFERGGSATWKPD